MAAVLLAAVVFTGWPAPARGQAKLEPLLVNPSQIRPAMLTWRIGTNRPAGPSLVIETVTPGTYENRATWRVTHYMADPAHTDDFDLYDMDRQTLAPIRSVMRNASFRLELLFHPQEVSRREVTASETTVERIPLSGPVQGEGPGGRVFLASLPLRPGYRTAFQIVGRYRWSGTEAGRVKQVTLTTTGPHRMETPMGPQDTLAVRMDADDGSFQHVEHVRVEPPHYPFLVEFTRGDRRSTSEVTGMAIEAHRDR